MSEPKLRVILLTHGEAEAVLRRLAALDCAEVAGVFVETAAPRRRPPLEALRRSIRYDGYAATLSKLARRLPGLNRAGAGARDGDAHAGLREAASALGVPVHFVPDYHAEESLALMRDSRPDLGVLCGTNIVRESVFGLPRLGSINLHQGLAPLYRGGPPVFWELFNGESEVGVTVHFVAAKVDSGDIVLQERVPLDYDPRFGLDFEGFIEEFRAGLRERCARMVAEAVRRIAEGTAARTPQDASAGKRYRLPTKAEKDELRRRLRARRREARGRGATAGAG